jgi:hypothetical protein
MIFLSLFNSQFKVVTSGYIGSGHNSTNPNFYIGLLRVSDDIMGYIDLYKQQIFKVLW